MLLNTQLPLKRSTGVPQLALGLPLVEKILDQFYRWLSICSIYTYYMLPRGQDNTSVFNLTLHPFYQSPSLQLQISNNMFLFTCCTQLEHNDVYELRIKQHQQKHFSVNNNLKNSQKQVDPTTQVLKVKKSPYQELIKQYKNSSQMWEDQQFPANHKSLGEIEGVTAASWKRLSKIIPNPVLFDGKIQPQDAIQGSLGDCYFLSAVSALAEKEERITAIFGQQEGIKFGIYRVTLRVNGIIEEILVDDYVPVNQRGEPIFCQPNKNEIWVPILEKAWAKANGSYANIIAGSPSEIFRAATYAPAETLETGNNKQQNEATWKEILESARLNRPCCCGTDDSSDIKWQSLHLVPGHAYTLIDAAQLENQEGSKVRMLKLRNPWGNTEWEGEGCENDTRFWASIVPNEAKSNFLRDCTVNNDGIFYIRFRDYCSYFTQTHICYMQQDGNYLYENFHPSPKRGTHWSLRIFQEGEYWIELHQDGARDNQQDQSKIARSTLVVARNKEPSSYEMVNGAMNQYKQDCSLRLWLTPGKYIIFGKLDANEVQEVPFQASVSVYSLYYAILDENHQKMTRSMIKQCLLNHARASKRRKYENDTLWISWKLMYKQGGYAYICFGAEKEAKSKWYVSFNESDFNSAHFKLKKPFKRKGQGQVFEVKPGEQTIIVARVANDNPTNLKFPPRLTYKIQPIT